MTTPAGWTFGDEMCRDALMDLVSADDQTFKRVIEAYPEITKSLRERLKEPCPHKNTQLHKEGMTGMCGTVTCLDCGYQRDWDAY